MRQVTFPLHREHHHQILDDAATRYRAANIHELFEMVGLHATYDTGDNITDVQIGSIPQDASIILELCEPYVEPHSVSLTHLRNNPNLSAERTLFGRHIPEEPAVSYHQLTRPQQVALHILAKAHDRWLNTTLTTNRATAWKPPPTSPWSSHYTATREQVRHVSSGDKVRRDVLQRLADNGLARPVGHEWEITHEGLNTLA